MENYNYGVKSIIPRKYYITTRDLNYKESLGPGIELSNETNDLIWNVKIDNMPLSVRAVINIVKLIFDIKELNITKIDLHANIMVVNPNIDEPEIKLRFDKSKDNRVEDYYEAVLDSIKFSFK